MLKLPVLKPQEVVSRLEALGFVEVRQRGAHKQFRGEPVRWIEEIALPVVSDRIRLTTL